MSITPLTNFTHSTGSDGSIGQSEEAVRLVMFYPQFTSSEVLTDVLARGAWHFAHDLIQQNLEFFRTNARQGYTRYIVQNCWALLAASVFA